ncbi:cytochrome P450 [Laetiporus sulphureus 93-53]|uniref:Cytochrome P450 n=1 Tax=Laetiporus sulphureus 93-53 TaxID=1314785 RepID=A0A165DNU2_9APHY|nr:cytochrome P450 [Laetiporus sulphureus 93-53]KZT05294.1 cytochrome P450 [Laetiporus sulphureus 93-53]
MSVANASNAALSLGLAALAYALWKLVPFVYRLWISPMRDLPGPSNPSWIYGNLKQIRNSEEAVLHEAWTETYGKTINYKGWMNTNRLYTVDTRALSHILSHSYDYPKPHISHFFLSRILGAGLLIVEGEQHRMQRRIMNPAFGPAQIRELTGIFVEKSMQLRDIWSAEIAKHGEPARVDVLSGLSKATLDVIGLAGFNYKFDSLNPEGKPNELSEAFSIMFESLSGAGVHLFRFFKAYIPPLRIIPDNFSRKSGAAQAVMRRIGMQLIADKKAAILKAAESEKDKENDDGSSLHGRDLLTLLIKANMSTDIPESQRLSDADVLAQVPTFLVAGHETTSNATTWCLFALSQAPEVQQKLREELWSIPTEDPTMDELNELPYLDAVVRETMRVHSPVVSTIRMAGKDDFIPLNAPYTDVHGQVRDSIKIDQGTLILIPVLAINRAKDLWGEDAFEFKPERWESPPDVIQTIPGVWGNLMSFLGGPRSCIGYRFSLVEMKALLFTLVRAFEFELAVTASDITKKRGIVQRPFVTSEMEKGHQLPLLIRPHVRV